MKLKCYPPAIALLTSLLSGCLFDKKSESLTKLSDGYCVPIAFGQYTLWTSSREKLKPIQDFLLKVDKSDPATKKVADDTSKYYATIMTTPIINPQADIELSKLFEKYKSLSVDTVKNEKAINHLDFEVLDVLKSAAPEFLKACRAHVDIVTKGCQELFDVNSGQFADCANPKLKEKTQQMLDQIVPGFRTIVNANSELKNSLSKLGWASPESTPSTTQ